jgi:hypothetical protein
VQPGLLLSGLGTDHDFDRYIGSRWLDLSATMIDRFVAFRRRIGEGRFFDIDYRRLAAEPLQTASDLYEWLGWSFDDEVQASMQTYLAANPKGRHGTHTYALSQFGLSDAQLADRFSDYREQFGLG